MGSGAEAVGVMPPSLVNGSVEGDDGDLVGGAGLFDFSCERECPSRDLVSCKRGAGLLGVDGGLGRWAWMGALAFVEVGAV